jgi:TrmH family RNA methyltransferase
MGDRLALARVARLSPRELSRYLGPLLNARRGSIITDTYLRTVLRQLVGDTQRPPTVRLAAADLESLLSMVADGGDTRFFAATVDSVLPRRLRALEEVIAHAAGIDPMPRDNPPAIAAGAAPALPVVIWAPHIRSPFNLGNIIRTAAAYGIIGVAVGEHAPDLDHPRVRRAAMGGDRIVQVLRGGPENFPEASDTPVVALETGGTDITAFAFPDSGVLVVGHEELGVPEEPLTRAARENRIVTIPHFGGKSSLNVGVATGIALSWWASRREG